MDLVRVLVDLSDQEAQVDLLAQAYLVDHLDLVKVLVDLLDLEIQLVMAQVDPLEPDHQALQTVHLDNQVPLDHLD